jgi:hypothetical protein
VPFQRKRAVRGFVGLGGFAAAGVFGAGHHNGRAVGVEIGDRLAQVR